MSAAPPGLHRLARLHGVQTAYHDNDGRRVDAAPDVLMAALHALRVPLREAADIPWLLELRRRELWDRVLEPVVVAWDHGPDASDAPSSSFTVRLPCRLADRLMGVAVNFEEGGVRRWEVDPATLQATERAVVDGRDYVALRAPLPHGPPGYHDLHLSIEDARFEALLISAPPRAAGWSDVVGARGWGLFAPLYALWEDSGGGPSSARPPTFHLLDRMAGLVADRGGSVAGTLPLLAAFLDQPYEPSPYAPVSRLFWNELYVEPPAGPDPGPATDGAPAVSVYRDSLFDPRAAMAAKRPALEAAARAFFGAGDDQEPAELASFRARNPRADDYARFRALVARWGRWSDWPDRLRGRDVRDHDFDRSEARYHLYVQWLAERQLTAVKERAGSRGVGLYLDLPLGVHPDGYDVWRDRELFAVGASAGAPPDALAEGGQDWGFPPLHPETGRFEGHRYFIACIRNHLRFARVLRIDHVMQFRRMYWAVGGQGDGVYVRYPAEELYAVLCLESSRAGSVIVGEDLGTVPRQVRRDMRRHGMPGMYVAQFELTEAGPADAADAGGAADAADLADAADAGGAAGAGGALRPKRVPAGALAAIGTHDTPTFAGWWTGRDAEIRGEMGQLEPGDAEHERAGRADLRRKLAAGLGVDGDPDSTATAEAVHRQMLRGLGRSRAGLVLATMEDLWLETEPQNTPGTTRGENWRRQARRPMDALAQPGIAEQLDALNESREGSHG